jgi:hypothetical protein
MFKVGDFVQIYNHSEPQCNGHYGTVLQIERAYDQSHYYMVQLEDLDMVCTCTDDEVMEG